MNLPGSPGVCPPHLRYPVKGGPGGGHFLRESYCPIALPSGRVDVPRRGQERGGSDANRVKLRDHHDHIVMRKPHRAIRAVGLEKIPDPIVEQVRDQILRTLVEDDQDPGRVRKNAKDIAGVPGLLVGSGRNLLQTGTRLVQQIFSAASRH